MSQRQQGPQSDNVVEDRSDIAGVIANLTHELKTPLHSIMSVAKVLSSEMDGPLNQEQHRQVAIIERNSAQLLSLITELLSVSALSFRRSRVQYEEIQLKRFLAPIFESNQTVALQKGLQFEFDLEGLSEQRFVSDAFMLKQILNNLLQNAIKYCEAKGTVSVYASRRFDHSLSVSIVDSGDGIAVQDQERVFEAFYQSKTAKGGASSVGLGLSLVKASVEELGGSVELKSEKGRGALFQVLLPSKDHLLEAKKILIVDQDEISREALVQSLQTEGYRVQFAEPSTAAEVGGQFLPDLLIVDIAVATADEGALLETIREAAAVESSCPLLFVASVLGQREREQVKLLGARDAVAKPFDVEVLLGKVASCLKQRN